MPEPASLPFPPAEGGRAGEPGPTPPGVPDGDAVRVALVPAPSGLPDFLTYLLPPGSDPVPVGACVLAPLGARQLLGYVVGGEPAAPAARRGLKPLLAVVDPQPSFDDSTLALLAWVAAEYVCSLSEALPLAAPQRHDARLERLIRIVPDWDGTLQGRAGPLTTRTALAIHRLLISAGGTLSRESLIAALPAPGVPGVLRRLRDQGALDEEQRVLAPLARPLLAKAVSLTAEEEEERGEPEEHADDPAERAPGATLEKSQTARLGPRQRQVLEHLRTRGAGPVPVPQRDLCAELGVDPGVVRRLESRGLLASSSVPLRRAPDIGPIADTEHLPTASQAAALEAVLEAMGARHDAGLRHPEAGPPGGVLIFGVTGSGKTEVYLRAIEANRSRGRTSILLVPEISLTAQVAAQVRARLGERVAILHSALSDGQRHDEWERLRRGEADVVVGPRSALFAPLPDPGLRLVDEEHDSSYKQGEPPPRYHARDVARQRARLAGGAVVFGSATPAMETYYQALTGRHRLVELPERVLQRPLPPVEIVDLRAERRRDPRAVLGGRLAEALSERLAAGQQAILFLNRRGFSAFLLCRECGLVPRCEHCDVSLTLHRGRPGALLCHYCGYQRRAPDRCSRCHGTQMHPFGLGTQRVEAAVRELLPGAKVARLDRDATRRRGSHARIVAAFRERRFDVLVGTQMVTKGFDFPGVTLVGVVTADIALNTPDFRAGERTFQLLTQVSGRAGRGEQAGEVIVQTFSPEHPSVLAAAQHDYPRFFRLELPHRQELGYPPFGRLVRLLAAAAEEAAAEGKVRAAAAELREPAQREGVEILGPTAAPLARLRDRYRWHLVLRARNQTAVHARLEHVLPTLQRRVGGLAIDVDPIDLL